VSTSEHGTADGASREQERGVLYGAAAYGLWGIFPLYFHILSPADAIEILIHRIFWTFLFCIIAWLWMRDLAWVRPLLRSPRRLALLSLAAVVIAANWGLYIYAVTSENVVESSLGYFINPLMLVLSGVFLLGEKLRRLQWIAVGLGALAVAIITFDYGRPPWLALGLAVTFTIYGFVKNRVGGGIPALASMTTETVVLLPFSIAGLIWLEVSGRGTFTVDAPWHGLAMVGTGIVTPIPLILFAAAASRIPLTTVGLLQFLAPILQLIIGVVVLGESVPGVRWIGFGIVWIALVILTVDTMQVARRKRATREASLRAAA